MGALRSPHICLAIAYSEIAGPSCSTHVPGLTVSTTTSSCTFQPNLPACPAHSGSFILWVLLVPLRTELPTKRGSNFSELGLYCLPQVRKILNNICYLNGRKEEGKERRKMICTYVQTVDLKQSWTLWAFPAQTPTHPHPCHSPAS